MAQIHCCQGSWVRRRIERSPLGPSDEDGHSVPPKSVSHMCQKRRTSYWPTATGNDWMARAGHLKSVDAPGGEMRAVHEEGHRFGLRINCHLTCRESVTAS